MLASATWAVIKEMSDIMKVICYKLTACGVTNYSSGWRKGVVNRCLECGENAMAVTSSGGWRSGAATLPYLSQPGKWSSPEVPTVHSHSLHVRIPLGAVTDHQLPSLHAVLVVVVVVVVAVMLVMLVVMMMAAVVVVVMVVVIIMVMGR